MDSTYRVRWIVPLASNEKAQGLDLGAEATRMLALEKARTLLVPTVTSPVDLVQGGKGFLVYIPLFAQGDFQGFILAVFRIQEWLSHVLKTTPAGGPGDFSGRVYFDEEPVFAFGEPQARNGIEAAADAWLLDHRLEVKVLPCSRYVRSSGSSLPLITAVLGTLLSLLVSLVVRLLQKAHAESRNTMLAKEALESEILERMRTESDLETALTRLDMATKAGGIGVWSWDIATDRLVWNERMFELYETSPKVRPSYIHWRRTLHGDDRRRVEDLLGRAANGGTAFDAEFRIVLASGKIRHLGAAAKLSRDANGRPRSLTGINWDLTPNKEAEEALRRSEAQFRLLLDSTAEAIYGIDLEGRCTFANPACARLLGYASSAQLLGSDMHTLIHHTWPDGRPMPLEDCGIHRAFKDGKGVHRHDEVLWRADGSSFPSEYWSYPQVVDGKTIGAVVTFNDITDRLEAEERIHHMATHDGLTDLPTLRLAQDRLTMALGLARRQGRQCAVLFLDLDRFKPVNDRHGHDAGDLVLKEVAHRLQGCVRETDTVARIGGDEFLLVLSGIGSGDDAALVAGNILDSLTESIDLGQNKVSIGASLGIALFPQDGDDPSQLVKKADEAMYRVKKSSRNGFGFATSICSEQKTDLAEALHG